MWTNIAFFFVLFGFYLAGTVLEATLSSLSMEYLTEWAWFAGEAFYLGWCIMSFFEWRKRTWIWLAVTFAMLNGLAWTILVDFVIVETYSSYMMCGTGSSKYSTLGGVALHALPVLFCSWTMWRFERPLAFGQQACMGWLFYSGTSLFDIALLGIYRACFVPEDVYNSPYPDSVSAPVSIGVVLAINSASMLILHQVYKTYSNAVLKLSDLVYGGELLPSSRIEIKPLLPASDMVGLPPPKSDDYQKMAEQVYAVVVLGQ
jgi:hypothetical protein